MTEFGFLGVRMKSNDERMRIGFGRVDITPPNTIPYLSFYPRQTPFQGVRDPLHARAMAAESESGSVVLISADALGFSRTILGPDRDFIEEVRCEIERRTGVPAGSILLAATHAHSTPQTTDLADLLGDFPESLTWLEQLIGQIAESAETAWNNRRPATLRSMVGKAPGICWCRRILTRDGRIVPYRERPADSDVLKEPRDESVPVVLVQGDDWNGVLVNFACHATTVQVQPLVSADYPGVTCRLIEQRFASDACLFFQGTCGNVNPLRGTSSFEDVECYGIALAEQVSACLRQLAECDSPSMPTEIRVVRETVALERRKLPDRAALEREVAAGKAAIDAARTPEEKAVAIARYRTAAEPLRLVQLGDGPVLCEVQVIRLGDILVVGIEGEVFVEYGLRIRKQSPASMTLICGYSNGYQGYIVTPETHEEGGYEVSLGPWSRVKRNAGEMLFERIQALILSVWK